MESDATADAVSQSIEDVAVTTDVTEEDDTAEADDTAEDDGVYINPLTGEVTETDISANRPIAVLLNTIKIALPQSGNSAADMYIEATEEGGITRVMGLYQDISGVGTLGTIRSTREYFTILAMGFDALMVHAGGSTYALNLLSDTGYESINFLTITSATMYWRDSDRQTNLGTEHSMYTSSDILCSYLETTTSRTTHEDDYVSPYTFAEDGTPDGEVAEDITVSFSSYKTTEFVYDEETGTYAVYFFDGEPYMDEASGTQVTVTNVVIVPTLQTTKDDGERQEYDLTSGGIGYFACGGKYIAIRWDKGDYYDSLVFTNTDGTPLDLGVGKTYICLVGDTRPITFE